MRFNVSEDGALRCSLDELVATRLLVQANSGGGKSWLLRRLFEQTHGHVQQIIIDPEGEFASLRERFDYVHACPTGGDTAATPRAAALLAERLLELQVSAILDIYELHPSERVRFVRVFLEALVNAPKRLWHPVLVAVDEAHQYAPEKGSAESLSAMIGLASLGRKRGFCALYATQRIQKLHKDVAAELNNKLIGRTTLDIDLARAADELGFSKARWDELKRLRPGQFFATGPAFTPHEVTLVQAGPVQTTHPKAGERIAFKAPPPTSKIRGLLPQLSDLPAEAEKKTKTEAELRAEIGALRKECNDLSREIARVKQEQQRIEVPVPQPETVQSLLDVWNATRRATDEHLIALMSEVRSALPKPKPFVNHAAAHRFAVTESAASTPTQAAGPLPKGQRAILTVLAQSPEGSTKSRLALLAGYAPSGGGFNNYLAALRSSGAIDGSDPLRITPSGLETLGPVENLPKGEALVGYWLAKLGKAERAILTYLIQCYPNAMPKETVAKAAGYEANGGGFNNALSRLRTIELIEGRGELRCAAALFEED